MTETIKLNKTEPRSPDAGCIIVRGFKTQERGEQICAALEENGYTIAESINGDSDSLGGLIETHIMPIDSVNMEPFHVCVALIALFSGEIDATWEGFVRSS
jgi:hypothetical protein